MKPNITPNDREVTLSDEDVIVSKTDLKGRITYANRTFMRISGYTEPDLYLKQHNIVRHPDMPRGAFKLLWDTVAKGEEFFAYVKNMCKDGSYYWVFANITPDLDSSGNIIGYFSVRRRPSRKAVQALEGVYRLMLDEERRAGAANAPAASIRLLTHLLEEKGTTYERFILEVGEE